MKTKKTIAMLLAVMLCISLNGCKKNERYQASFLGVFDTVTTIVGFSESKKDFTACAEFIRERLTYYNNLYDIYNLYEGINNIKTVNDNAGIRAVKVDKDLIDLIDFGKAMYTLTSGKVNIAMGSVLSLWHMYREEGVLSPDNARLPLLSELTIRAEHCDIDSIIIDYENSTVYLDDSEMSIDVGAIAKGYAAQRVTEELVAAGYNNLAISVGGNAIAIGPQYDGSSWRIGIQNPDTDSDEQNYAYLEISDEAIVSSGSYQRYYTVDNVRYHHIIDPQTLYPKNDYLSVTVICQDSAMADALSTALFNMGIEEGTALVSSLEGIYVFYILPDGSSYQTEGFDEFLAK